MAVAHLQFHHCQHALAWVVHHGAEQLEGRAHQKDLLGLQQFASSAPQSSSSQAQQLTGCWYLQQTLGTA